VISIFYIYFSKKCNYINLKINDIQIITKKRYLHGVEKSGYKEKKYLAKTGVECKQAKMIVITLLYNNKLYSIFLS